MIDFYRMLFLKGKRKMEVSNKQVGMLEEALTEIANMKIPIPLLERSDSFMECVYRAKFTLELLKISRKDALLEQEKI